MRASTFGGNLNAPGVGRARQHGYARTAGTHVAVTRQHGIQRSPNKHASAEYALRYDGQFTPYAMATPMTIQYHKSSLAPESCTRVRCPSHRKCIDCYAASTASALCWAAGALSFILPFPLAGKTEGCNMQDGSARCVHCRAMRRAARALPHAALSSQATQESSWAWTWA